MRWVFTIVFDLQSVDANQRRAVHCRSVIRCWNVHTGPLPFLSPPEVIKLMRMKPGTVFRMVEKGAPAVHPCLEREIDDGPREILGQGKQEDGMKRNNPVTSTHVLCADGYRMGLGHVSPNSSSSRYDGRCWAARPWGYEQGRTQETHGLGDSHINNRMRQGVQQAKRKGFPLSFSLSSSLFSFVVVLLLLPGLAGNMPNCC